MLTKKLNIPIFDATVYVAVSDKFNDMLNYYNLETELHGNAIACVIPLKDDNVYYLLLIDRDIGIIVHECNHIKNNILLYAGHKPAYDNDEIDCYLLDWLVTKIWKIVNNRR
jgi:hypothetical protein